MLSQTCTTARLGGAPSNAVTAFAPAPPVPPLVVGPHILFSRNAEKIVELAARHKVPTMYFRPADVVLGGLMSYSGVASARLIGSLNVAQILGGAKPADLPVQGPTKFQMVINLKTAKALGLKVPPTLFALADEVIE